MNNKGFTIIELLASFILSMIIVVIMFQLIINLKDLYKMTVLKSELQNKQNIITNKIYDDLINKKVKTITESNEINEQGSIDIYYIEFTFDDNISKKLTINTRENYISYDNYIVKLNQSMYFEEVLISTKGTGIETGYNRILSINVPITNQIFRNENFGINIVYPYNNLEINVVEQ